MMQPLGALVRTQLGTAGAQSAAARAASRIRFRENAVRLAFLLIVVAPTALSALYTGIIATPRYVS